MISRLACLLFSEQLVVKSAVLMSQNYRHSIFVLRWIYEGYFFLVFTSSFFFSFLLCWFASILDLGPLEPFLVQVKYEIVSFLLLLFP